MSGSWFTNKICIFFPQQYIFLHQYHSVVVQFILKGLLDCCLRSDSHRSHHGNHPRSHRHRRMRDYDSDTGYRSDQELMKFRRQQQQMFQRANDNYSEIVPIARSKGRRRDGYSSDLEGYSQRSMGAAYRETNGTDNVNSINNSQSQNKSSNVSVSQYSQSGAVRNDEFYEQSLTDPSKAHYPSSSPSPLQRRNVVDQSTPLTPTATRSNFNKKDVSDFEFKKDLFNVQDSHRSDAVIDPENRYMVSTVFYRWMDISLNQ